MHKSYFLCQSAILTWGPDDPAPAHLLSVISYLCRPISLYSSHLASLLPLEHTKLISPLALLHCSICLETSNRSSHGWLIPNIQVSPKLSLPQGSLP